MTGFENFGKMRIEQRINLQESLGAMKGLQNTSISSLSLSGHEPDCRLLLVTNQADDILFLEGKKCISVLLLEKFFAISHLANFCLLREEVEQVSILDSVRVDLVSKFSLNNNIYVKHRKIGLPGPS